MQDDGIGIGEEKQKLIFQNFEQADESEIARRQETGLGLANSRRLIHMMDSKTKALMFGGNEMSFLIDIQGTGKCIIESLGGQLMVSSL